MAVCSANFHLAEVNEHKWITTRQTCNGNDRWETLCFEASTGNGKILNNLKDSELKTKKVSKTVPQICNLKERETVLDVIAKALHMCWAALHALEEANCSALFAR